MNHLNFSPGPACLPQAVKQRLAEELQKECSFFEKSHRREEVKALWHETRKTLLNTLKLPSDYLCFLMPGGARLQISHFWQRYSQRYHWAIAMTGYWGRWSYHQARMYNRHHITAVGPLSCLQPFDGLYYCDNETLSGACFQYQRAYAKQYLVVDQTSSLLTRPFPADEQPADVIIAACQKNLGFSGASIVIMHPRFLEELEPDSHHEHALDYRLQRRLDNDACTPSLMHYWVLHAMLEWVEQQGGLEKIAGKRAYWAHRLYSIIDSSENLINKIPQKNRSEINITFDFKKEAQKEQARLDAALEQARCYAFRGHPAYSSGYRLSLYNAVACMDLEELCDVLSHF